MHLFVINKKVYFKDYKLNCSIGKRGITSHKKEGDKCTPRGTFNLKYILYRKDRLSRLQTNLKKKIIKINMGWCDDIKSKQYNKLVSFPFKYHAEKLYKKDSSYDIIIVTSHNTNPVKKGKGSAIFIHASKKRLTPTAGCISLNKKDLIILLKYINNKSKISIF